MKELINRELWFYIYEKTKEKNPRNRKKLTAYKQIIDSGEYIDIACQVLEKKYIFSIPKKVEINKIETNKKKTIYIFNYQDDMLLKVFARILMTKYSHLISEKCHSFQSNKGAKTAFKSILSDKSINQKWAYKTDISNFFNSIYINDFLKNLPIEIKKDSVSMYVLYSVLNNNFALFENKIIRESKGLMAGTAIAPFLSNLYLQKVDDYFASQKVTYARYSDDILLFDDKIQLQNHINYLKIELNKRNLTINKSKTSIIPPEHEWTFLGFSYHKGTIEIAKVTQQKLKAKIKRLSKRYLRLKTNKQLSDNEIVTMLINKINRKMLGKNFDNNDLCWSRWFFPLINTAKSLKEIDKFVQDKIRYSITGCYQKKNYKILPYSTMQRLNYQPISKLYYLFKHDFEKFNRIVQNMNTSLQT